MATLVITEKPSAANKIAFALADGTPKTRKKNQVTYFEVERDGKTLIVAPSVGHLFTLYPKTRGKIISDATWRPSWQNKKSYFSKKYYLTLESLAKKADDFIAATDTDVEGETIALNILRFLCNQKDAKRMKFSTMTKVDLQKAYFNASKTLDWGLANSGVARHFLDFIYGLNLSKFAMDAAWKATGKHLTLSIGRVQGPALSLLAAREREIQKFKPVPFWQIFANFNIKRKKYTARHKTDRFWQEAEAKQIFAKVKDKPGAVKKISKSTKPIHPPFPFDLTSLQIEAYRVFRMNPKTTLSIAQSLYTRALISYPRTSSQKLPAKLGFKNILNKLMKNPKYLKPAHEVLQTSLKPNEGRKTDVHPAIFPTGEFPKALKPHEAKIYDLIVRRFFAVFGQPGARENTNVEFDVETEPFVLRGTRTVKLGWQAWYMPYAKSKELELPTLKIGEVYNQKTDFEEKETQPPSRYNPSSIIKELEKRNLGTKCLTQDTKVLCGNSHISIKNIFDDGAFIKKEDDTEIRKINSPKVVSVNESSFHPLQSKPILVSRRKLNPNEKVFSLKTELANFTATQDHPIYILRKNSMKLIKLSELKKYDKLISVLYENKEGKLVFDVNDLNSSVKKVGNKYLHKFASIKNKGMLNTHLPIRWSQSLAWVLGYFYGDGSYSDPKYGGAHQVYFTTTEEKALDLLQMRIKNVFGFEPYVYNLGRKYKVNCNALMSSVLVKICPELTKKQPFKIPSQFIGDFIRGFFDADGNIHLRPNGKVTTKFGVLNSNGTPRLKFTLANPILIQWIYNLLTKLDIEATPIKKSKAKIQDKSYDCFTFRISGKDNVEKFAYKVGFDVPHKLNTLITGLNCKSLHYKPIQNSAEIVKVIKRLGEVSIERIINESKFKKYDVHVALKRLLKFGVVKKHRIRTKSNWNCWIYKLIDEAYFKHAVRLSCKNLKPFIYAVDYFDLNKVNYNGFVYDLSVSEKSPNFLIDGGILVHNSTRANIIETLVDRGYIQGVPIQVTGLGLKMVDTFGKYAPEILSETLTRRFEDALDKIREGKVDKEKVIDSAKRVILKISKEFEKHQKEIGSSITESFLETQKQQNTFFPCRKCKKGSMVMRISRASKKRFLACDLYPTCKTTLPLPQKGKIVKTKEVCKDCQTPIISIYTYGRKPWKICPDPKCPSKSKE